MALNDLTGERGNALKCLEITVESLRLMGDPNAKNFIALTTDNPTTMQSFRRLFQDKFFWILTFACFLHSLNTLVGEICTYPLIKKIIANANWTVTFFNSSHYWGGQLQAEAKRLLITRGLKKNLLSSINNLYIIQIVIHTPKFWSLLTQLTRITKPIVDAIGNCESRQATLADCMLELIRCARTMSKMRVEENEDQGFLKHAKETFDRRFKMISTPIHWLALFLHPLCRKLAVSNGAALGPSLDSIIETALKIAKQWRWSAAKAMQLKADLKAYSQCKSPFSGGQRDAREWWKDVPKENHESIRLLGVVLASVVPHAADVEQLFSDLGGIQTPPRNNMTVETMEKTGKIRSRLNYEHYLKVKQEAGSTVHRQHNHMHTQATPGININLVKDLENPITWIPPLDGGADDEGDVVDKAFQELNKTIEDEAPAVPTPGSITGGELVDFTKLDRVDRGEAVTAEEDNMDVTGDGRAGTWSIEELMGS
ncbi:ribonuclease H-like domain-containing protein [Mycena metata]|uniref:Ribonuclease H-like domain-containing protein n=1 Tax=Mycena metata TaxID=1033252 RepID=A0AAD7MWN9_9AGAR|nr:ribonuclease H-like domain-containing protein [Mycena metata]